MAWDRARSSGEQAPTDREGRKPAKETAYEIAPAIRPASQVRAHIRIRLDAKLRYSFSAAFRRKSAENGLPPVPAHGWTERSIGSKCRHIHAVHFISPFGFARCMDCAKPNPSLLVNANTGFASIQPIPAS
jgi:hypothetical protein